MKTTLRSLAIAILFVINMNSFVCGQGNSNTQRIIDLLEGSIKKDIVIPITEQTDLFAYKLSAGVSEGEIIIEVYDPSGERVKRYSVGLTQPHPDNLTKAVMVYQPFRNPVKGNWIIKITAKDAKGSFDIEITPKISSDDQPTKTITGTITYEGTKPYYGAIVLVKGTTIGSRTDKSGSFSLKVPINAESLIFYSEGMKKQEVKIGEQTSFKINLER